MTIPRDIKLKPGDSAILTSREVIRKFGISKYTLLNWRRGHYYVGGKRKWFFPDESVLAAEWNEDLRRLEYNPVSVAVWARKVQQNQYAKRVNRE